MICIQNISRQVFLIEFGSNKTLDFQFEFEFFQFLNPCYSHGPCATADSKYVWDTIYIFCLLLMYLKFCLHKSDNSHTKLHNGPNHLFYQTSSRTILLDVQQNVFLLDVQQQKNSLSTGRPVDGANFFLQNFLFNFSTKQTILSLLSNFFKKILLDVQQMNFRGHGSSRKIGLLDVQQNDSTGRLVEFYWTSSRAEDLAEYF